MFPVTKYFHFTKYELLKNFPPKERFFRLIIGGWFMSKYQTYLHSLSTTPSLTHL